MGIEKKSNKISNYNFVLQNFKNFNNFLDLHVVISISVLVSLCPDRQGVCGAGRQLQGQ